MQSDVDANLMRAFRDLPGYFATTRFSITVRFVWYNES